MITKKGAPDILEVMGVLPPSTMRIIKKRKTFNRTNLSRIYTALNISLLNACELVLTEEECKKFKAELSDIGSQIPNSKNSQQSSHNFSLVSNLLSKLPGFVHNDLMTVNQLRELFMAERDKRPMIFYHWRQRSQKIHWVDFYFIAVLRLLQEYGMEAYALITCQGASLEIVELYLRRFSINYFEYENVKKEFETRYADFAHACVSPSILRRIWNKASDTEAWLQFVPWWVLESNRRSGYCELIWRRHYSDKHELKHAFHKRDSNNKFVPIFTDDILIGGAEAKLVHELHCIDIPPSRSVLNWLRDGCCPSYDDMNVINDYFRTIINNSDSKDHAHALDEPTKNSILEITSGKSAAYQKKAIDLATSLSMWDTQ